MAISTCFLEKTSRFVLNLIPECNILCSHSLFFVKLVMMDLEILLVMSNHCQISMRMRMCLPLRPIL